MILRIINVDDIQVEANNHILLIFVYRKTHQSHTSLASMNPTKCTHCHCHCPPVAGSIIVCISNYSAAALANGRVVWGKVCSLLGGRGG